MPRTDAFAYLLIGLGALALLARLSGGAGWLWLGLVAAALLVAYAQQRTYGFLVLGGVLAGSAVGLLLQSVFPRGEGVFLISLGLGLVAIDRVERRTPRWSWVLGWVLTGLGVVTGLASSGLLSSTWFALLLIAAGALLLWRRREAAAFPPQVRGGPGPSPDAVHPKPATPPSAGPVVVATFDPTLVDPEAAAETDAKDPPGG